MKEDKTFLEDFDSKMMTLVVNQLSDCCKDFLNADSDSAKSQSRENLYNACELYINNIEFRDQIERTS